MSQAARASHSRAWVWEWPNATTSIGSGKAPSVFTTLAASAMTTQRREASQTSFSRRRAAPPPLISDRPGPISSAPSTVRSMVFASSRVSNFIPSEVARSAVACEVGTPLMLSPLVASAFTNHAAVEPVPRPTTMPGSTSAAAASPASRFWSSALIWPSPPSSVRGTSPPSLPCRPGSPGPAPGRCPAHNG